jgi:NAD(P)-dependent dehydrogenase (short-subunit alcohol dehydrogenase family)
MPETVPEHGAVADPGGAPAPSDGATLVPGHAGPARVLVVGASQGIGLALAGHLATHAGVSRLFLASRTAPESAALRALQQSSAGRVDLLACDLTDETSVARLGAAVGAAGGGLNLVINTAGLLHERGLAPEKTVRQVTQDNLQRAFATNAFGPILLARELLPQLAPKEPVVFASLSARVGSIGDNRLGGWYAYRASKAAQNQLLRSFAIELARTNRRAIVLALHPGTVDTALSQPFGGSTDAASRFTPEFAAGRLLQVIAARSPADSGGFFAWDGQPIPW